MTDAPKDAGADGAKPVTPPSSSAPPPPPPPTEARGGRARRGAGVAYWAFASMLGVAVAVMVNYLAFRHYKKWDWTTEGLYTLSGRTEQVLHRLPRSVQIYVFLSSAEQSFAEVHELLDRYKSKSDRVTIRYVDPDCQPQEFMRLAQRYGVSAAALETGETVADVAAVVVAGDRHWTITRDDLVSVDMDTLGSDEEGGGANGSTKLQLKAEQALTGALVQVTQGKRTKICVTKGHGEWPLETGGDRSLQPIKELLERDNIDLQEIETLGAREIPEDCDAVFVIGPQRAFGEAEAALLGRYVRGGGRALLALDPVLDREHFQPTGLEAMARELGVRIDDSVVIEKDDRKRSPQGFFLATAFGDDESLVAVKARGGPAVFVVPRSIRPVEGSSATVLVRASEQSFGETNLAALGADEEPTKDAADIDGPVSLAVAVEVDAAGGGRSAAGARARKGRLVVVGESQWMLYPFLEAAQFVNYDLLTSWTGWLTERPALISIAPKSVHMRAIVMTEDDLSGLLFRVLVLLPAAALLLGVAVWWSRRFVSPACRGAPRLSSPSSPSRSPRSSSSSSAGRSRAASSRSGAASCSRRSCARASSASRSSVTAARSCSSAIGRPATTRSVTGRCARPCAPASTRTQSTRCSASSSGRSHAAR